MRQNIRLVRVEDAQDLLNIYGQYIDTPITFEYVLPTKEEFEKRIRNIAAEYPYLVYEEEGEIRGYAYAHRCQERAAYGWNAELSVYLDRRTAGKGIGKKLYTKLLQILEMQNVKTAYGCVTVPNPASENLHISMGFRKIGTYHNAGFKDGAWRDVTWFELAGEYECPPKPWKSISQIEKEKIQEILEEEEETTLEYVNLPLKRVGKCRELKENIDAVLKEEGKTLENLPQTRTLRQLKELFAGEGVSRQGFARIEELMNREDIENPFPITEYYTYLKKTVWSFSALDVSYYKIWIYLGDEAVFWVRSVEKRKENGESFLLFWLGDDNGEQKMQKENLRFAENIRMGEEKGKSYLKMQAGEKRIQEIMKEIHLTGKLVLS